MDDSDKPANEIEGLVKNVRPIFVLFVSTAVISWIMPLQISDLELIRDDTVLAIPIIGSNLRPQAIALWLPPLLISLYLYVALYVAHLQSKLRSETVGGKVLPQWLFVLGAPHWQFRAPHWQFKLISEFFLLIVLPLTCARLAIFSVPTHAERAIQFGTWLPIVSVVMCAGSWCVRRKPQKIAAFCSVLVVSLAVAVVWFVLFTGFAEDGVEGKSRGFLGSSVLGHNTLDLSNKVICSPFSSPEIQTFTCDMRRWRLEGANLSGATLIRADMRGVKLNNANLTKADLYQADLSGASLKGTRFDGAYLGCAYFDGLFIEDTYIENDGRRIDGASFADAHMPEAVLMYMEGSNVDFSGAFMPLVYLSNMEISDSSFRATVMDGAFFLFGNKFINVDFEHASFGATTWHHVVLGSVDFLGAKFDASKWSCHSEQVTEKNVTWPEEEQEFVWEVNSSCNMSLKVNPDTRLKKDEDSADLTWLRNRFDYFKHLTTSQGIYSARGERYLLDFWENFANKNSMEVFRFDTESSVRGLCAVWRSEWLQRNPNMESRLSR